MIHFRPQRYVFLLKKRLVSRKNSDRHCDVFVCYDLGGGLLEGVLAQALAAATGVKSECSLLVGHAPLVSLL